MGLFPFLPWKESTSVQILLCFFPKRAAATNTLCASKCHGLLRLGVRTEEKEGGRGCWSWEAVMGAHGVMCTLGSQSSSLGPTALWLQRQSHDRGQCVGSCGRVLLSYWANPRNQRKLRTFKNRFCKLENTRQRRALILTMRRTEEF